MARVPEPVVEDKDPPSPPKPVSKTWSNKKEDYELKDVIGMCMSTPSRDSHVIYRQWSNSCGPGGSLCTTK